MNNEANKSLFTVVLHNGNSLTFTAASKYEAEIFALREGHYRIWYVLSEDDIAGQNGR